jgi:hypothetical protein
MTDFGFMAGVTMMKQSAALGQKDRGIAPSPCAVERHPFFAIVFAIGIAMLRRSEVHKRSMLLRASRSSAPPSRAGPDVPGASRTARPAAGRGGRSRRLGGLSAAVVAMVYDWRTPAYRTRSM